MIAQKEGNAALKMCVFAMNFIELHQIAHNVRYIMQIWGACICTHAAVQTFC